MTKQATNLSDNPFLVDSQFPQFGSFHVEHIEPAVSQLLKDNRKVIEDLVADNSQPTWQNFIEPLEFIDNRFEKIWGPVGHLDATMNSDEWHEAYTNCLEQVTQYYTETGQNAGLYQKFNQLAESDEYETYNLAQQKVIENALRNFRLSGIALPKNKQAIYKELKQQLSQNSSQFGNNVLKATQAWYKHIKDESELAGLPESAMGLLQQLAGQKSLEGWCVTLDFPSYLAVLTHADNRELREEVYKAFSTRASEQSNHAEFDNSELIETIRADRHKLASLLGFKNYAEYSLATKMAESTDQVLGFLRDLAVKSKPQAEKELSTLKAFAKSTLGIDDFQPWDVTYASEKLKNETLSLSQEKLRPYFPVETVLKGLFLITKTLFNIKITVKEGVETWHKDVRFFELTDEANQVVGHFYLDLYARENKRGGAWMDSAITRWKHPQGQLQTPVTYLVCNFTPPIGDKEACLTHDEVTTLFHEFGHGIHHLFTKMEQLDVSGISGVPWDAVELPSQFMENFCWEREGLNFISSHIETGETLPDDLFEALQKGRGFQSAMMMLRQIEFALVDFELHTFYNPDAPEDVLDIAQRIRNEVAVVQPPSYSRQLHSFSHIFAGGYAAGYYSYKWAEVLSADAFSLFEETGILNSETGMHFKNTILAAGGSVDPMVLFKAFRGREPQIDALLRHSGIRA
ncbi:M3 family metallopeptidase [Thiomicrorhabdus lithotrophica]|uniref:oligopeptidase A n=1 Tax=Thiomicrorhabdus lithotrophica TaxID=2949997 RepID=A0ABY8CD74_9GAMM|nr:M3 family metallopeptidase [Thiomicrorhabdus lithotrophica]WEJ62722.1 M3 family metallopeptidase [Thiomicrorhabdus lithotrophica]